jgi:DNA-binding NarL/FixJ family response regulator
MKILIADTSEIFAEGLAMLINRKTNFSINAIVGRHESIIAELLLTSAQLLLIDIAKPDARFLALVLEIGSTHPSTRILVMSEPPSSEYFEELINVGIYGFIEKNTGIDEIIMVINKIAEGNNYFGNTITSNFFKFKKAANLNKRLETKISPREKEVLQYIVKGHSTVEISKKLFVSKYTIDSHRKNLLKKLGVRNAVELTQLAIAKNLI